MSSISIRNISITDLSTDCIVNAANSGLWAGGGVCGAIFRAAGAAQLTKACAALGGCPEGSAVCTPGFRLKAKYIVHAVGPRWQGGSHGEDACLRSAYRSALAQARACGCRSIGFPLISAGIFGYPLREAWQAALETVREDLDAHPDQPLEVVFAVLDPEILALGAQTLEALSL